MMDVPSEELPEHASVAQSWTESPEQSAPPAGVGLLQDRVWVPPPQVTEQALQSPKPPSTYKKKWKIKLFLFFFRNQHPYNLLTVVCRW